MSDDRNPTPLRDSKSNLYEAARAAIEDQESKADQERTARMSASGRRRSFGLLFLVGLTGALLLILRPVWLVGPDRPPPESPAVATASLRLGMLRERDRIFEYRRSNGRLPATLAEAGIALPDLLYQVQGVDSFQLTGQSGDSVIVLQSGDDMTAFLGGSLQVIRDRGR